jgi:type II secretory pathway pseudopilin PulG
MSSWSKAGAGFTIVETMIVLGISGLMFTLAISAMSGKQQQTEFQTGVNTLKAELDGVMSNVSDGNYGNIDSVVCTSAASGQPVITTPPTSPIGLTGSCDIIGQVVSFAGTSGSPSSYSVYPIYGRTYVSNSVPTLATTITDAMPILGSSASTTLPFGLELTSYSNTTPGVNETTLGPGANVGAFGITSFTSFEGGSAYANGNLSSGSQHYELFGVPSSSYSMAPSVAGLMDTYPNCPAVNEVCTNTSNAEPINPSGGIVFCLASGTTGQSALFTLGGSGDGVAYKIYSTNNCT